MGNNFLDILYTPILNPGGSAPLYLEAVRGRLILQKRRSEAAKLYYTYYSGLSLTT